MLCRCSPNSYVEPSNLLTPTQQKKTRNDPVLSVLFLVPDAPDTMAVVAVSIGPVAGENPINPYWDVHGSDRN